MSTLNDQITATEEKIADLDRQSVAYRRVLEILQELRDRGSAPELEKKKRWVYQGEREEVIDWQDYMGSAKLNFYTVTPSPLVCPNCHKTLVAGEIHVCI